MTRNSDGSPRDGRPTASGPDDTEEPIARPAGGRRRCRSSALLLCAALLGSLLLWPFGTVQADDARAPVAETGARIILSPYIPGRFTGPRLTHAHKLGQMPLNWLGLDLVQFDLSKDVPDPADPSVRGVLMWMPSDSYDWLPEKRYAKVLERLYGMLHRALDHGRKVAVIGSLPAPYGEDAARSLERMHALMARIGLEEEGDWSMATYRSRLVKADPQMVDFERRFGRVLPPMTLFKPVAPDVTSHLVIDRRGDPRQRSHLIVTSPRGGLIAEGFSHYTGPGTDLKQWYVNPFTFFARAFATDGLPKPDYTTLAGRRIYYSHIDGDGWRSLSTVERYQKKAMMSAEVVHREAIAPFPDLPVAVAPIAADLDPDWFGSDEAQTIARDLFALPQVEVASHTYSHPFAWEFYQRYDRSNELPFLPVWARYNNYELSEPGDPRAQAEALKRVEAMIGDNYDVPRAYGKRPFRLEKEIAGSLRYLERFAPEGKRGRLLQWSGNTSPFPEALAASYAENGLNINGGDSRFDREFPSHIYVAPVGIRLGGQLQVYASNSNENTYTDLWQSRFFGFGDLPETWERTETPRRLQAANLYYHMYSGEKEAALNALLANIADIREREIIPIDASHYTEIGLGFFHTHFVAEGKRRWRVRDRGRLQTIRFGGADRLQVDLDASIGVLGQRWHQRQLYVALDEAVAEPLIVLADRRDEHPASRRPYLISSRWPVWSYIPAPSGFSLQARGFGPGEMRWRVPWEGRWQVAMRGPSGETRVEAVARDGMLDVVLPARTAETVDLVFTRLGE